MPAASVGGPPGGGGGVLSPAPSAFESFLESESSFSEPDPGSVESVFLFSVNQTFTTKTAHNSHRHLLLISAVLRVFFFFLPEEPLGVFPLPPPLPVLPSGAFSWRGGGGLLTIGAEPIAGAKEPSSGSAPGRSVRKSGCAICFPNGGGSSGGPLGVSVADDPGVGVGLVGLTK